MYCPIRSGRQATFCFECVTSHGEASVAREFKCPVCCSPLPDAGAKCANPLCRRPVSERQFGRVFAAATMSGAVAAMIHMLKPRNAAAPPKTHYATVLGGYLAGWAEHQRSEIGTHDLVLPVPAHPDRVTDLGIDITGTLVGVIERSLGDMLGKCLIDAGPVISKTHRVEARSRGNSWQERQDAVRDAYQLEPLARETVSGASVLVVDDVLTTGTNLGAVAGQLLRAGAKCVDGLVVARVIYEGRQ